MTIVSLIMYGQTKSWFKTLTAVEIENMILNRNLFCSFQTTFELKDTIGT